MEIVLQAPERSGSTPLPGQRLLAWAEWGPAWGVPILFCPGAATSRSLGFGAGLLERLGARLIAIDRPGLGSSSPMPGRSLSDWAVDVSDFLHARALPPAAIVGFSQGAPFALACAAQGVVTRVALVSGGDELAHPALRQSLHPAVASMVELAASDPAGAEAYFAGMTAQMMWDLVIGMSGDVDRAVFTAPTFAAAYRRALDEGFAQGSAGYARDTLLAMSRWPFDPAAIRVPVELWYGTLDTSTVHSPDHGETLARRIPGARRHVLPQAGSALLWTHAQEILGALRATSGDGP